jgi:hypothetical protein
VSDVEVLVLPTQLPLEFRLSDIDEALLVSGTVVHGLYLYGYLLLVE